MAADIIPPSPSPEEHLGSAPEADDRDFASEDPVALFENWFALAKDKEPRDPHAMALATADADGVPDVRMVLLKGLDEDPSAAGFVFYTNTESQKGAQLADNAHAALCFYWKSIVRQVRVRGPITPVSDAEADAYFASRARDSRIGAWASAQSRPMEGRFALEKSVAAYGVKYAVGDVPRPPHWSGYRLHARRIEFWRERPFRLHDRFVFERDAPGVDWRKTRLYP